MTYPSATKTVLIGKETTWGTAVTADKDVGLVEEITDNFAREVIETLGLGAIDVQRIDGGIFDPGHSVIVQFQHGRLLEYVFGTVAHAQTSSDWKHTFTISTTPPSLTMESGNNLTTDTVLTTAGLLVETAEVSVNLNEVVKLRVDLKGKTTTSSATAAAAVIDNLPVFPHHMVTVSLNGGAIDEVQSFTMTITKTLERSGGMGTTLYQQGHATDIKFEWSGTFGFQDKTLQELYLGGTTPATGNPTAFDVKFEADNGTALGSGQRNLTIELENNICTTFDETATLGSLTFFDMAGKGTLKEAFSVDDITSAAW